MTRVTDAANAGAERQPVGRVTAPFIGCLPGTRAPSHPRRHRPRGWRHWSPRKKEADAREVEALRPR
jgi:hypothetical protein